MKVIHKHIKQRLIIKGKDAWKKLTSDELIQTVQDQIVDCINNLNWLRVRDVDLTHHIFHLESLYKTLESKKKKK